MTTVFHLRLLDAGREVLGWTKVPATTRGDGCLWAAQNFVFEAERSGVGTAIHVHWPDINVRMTLPLPQPIPVDAGKVYTLPVTEKPLLRIGGEDLPVPPVTVRTPVEIGVATAAR